MPIKMFSRLFFLGALCAASMVSAAEPIDLAREFLAGLNPQKNAYQYNGSIHWKGDRGLFSEYTDNEANVDCSGFVGAILQKANSRAYDAVAKRTRWKQYPKAANFYEAISQGWGFIPRPTVYSVEAGDVFALRHEANTPDTGHVMFVDAKPVQVKAREPIVAGTTQWDVLVIDSVAVPHGKNDTRYFDGEKHSGVGRGATRLYVNANGEVIGYVFNPQGRDLKLTSLRPIAFGKPL